MRSISFFLVALFAFAATSSALVDVGVDFVPTLEARKAHKNNTAEGNPENRQCNRLARLTKLTALAANQTRLDALVAKGRLNETQVENIKAKAANATSTLQTMQSNTTLVQECEVVEAHKQVVRACKKMRVLDKLSTLANNQTAMNEFIATKQLNGTKLEKFQDSIGNATAKLQDLQKNTTLTNLCAQEQKAQGADGSATSSGNDPPAQSTGGATSLSLQAMPYAVVPALAAVFAAFL
ncbi:hypothetical protein EJ04DRAFT_560509 [Polyplosphaeria fusca]|uniref:Uncharacterized protein n=1 Tax=Polyplosphaeria fusca TaxID=682080 RepID=A0A9P4R6A3_9PLEO|nr:hypothetical protein EJ04DRAFT_560509 [Polyplosphaeria fusca]